MDRRQATPRQLARLVEEIEEVGLRWDGSEPWHEVAIIALEFARRPATFEHRTPSFGAIIAPTTDPATWDELTNLHMERRGGDAEGVFKSHLYADGLSSWILFEAGERRPSGLVFDRPAGSERDMVVIAEAMGATLVQRHPDGYVRIVGPAGVHRWDGMDWQHQPPLGNWLDVIVAASCDDHDDEHTLEKLLEFALHDLASRRIGATLIYRAHDDWSGGREQRLPLPPPLRIADPPDLAPLRHALAQVDGAAVFDECGTLREIGVRLVPTTEAEADVPGLGGMRHTSARRYSADDTNATMIVVSESGRVTVMRQGRVLGVAPGAPDDDSID